MTKAERLWRNSMWRTLTGTRRKAELVTVAVMKVTKVTHFKIEPLAMFI